MGDKSSWMDAMNIAANFARTRWQLDFRRREQLEAWQRSQLSDFMRFRLPLAAYYRGINISRLEQLPCMDKTLLMQEFSARNTRGIRLDQALELALKAEQSRDFSATLGDLTVGLSSGTSGQRGVFLVSTAERRRWAGILLARTLPQHLLRHLLTPWRPPLRIAFFLRANSRLYTTLHGRRIDFAFHDLLDGLDSAIPRLNTHAPDVLVAPATVLRALADEQRDGRLHIQPTHILSVAEVLEDADALVLESAFGRKPHQIYQATEGFLGYTCEEGTVHLNETHVFFEPDWLDEEHTRFQPVITDFTRETQLIVRYRLNDILRVAPAPCPCGRVERAIAAIDGRSDEILHLPSVSGAKQVAIFPDVLRREMALSTQALREYSILQRGTRWQIDILAEGERSTVVRSMSEAIQSLCRRHDARMPELSFGMWQAAPPGAKRRRIRVEQNEGRTSCTY